MRFMIGGRLFWKHQFCWYLAISTAPALPHQHVDPQRVGWCKQRSSATLLGSRWPGTTRMEKTVDSKKHMQYFNVQICTCKLRRLNIWKLCWEILLCRTIHDPYFSTLFPAESTPYCPPETIRQDPQCLSHMLFVFFIQRFSPQNLKPFKPIKSLAWNDKRHLHKMAWYMF